MPNPLSVGVTPNQTIEKTKNTKRTGETMNTVAVKAHQIPQLKLVITPRAKSWFKIMLGKFSAAVARALRAEDDIETWRRLEFRNEMPRERQIERAQWRI